MGEMNTVRPTFKVHKDGFYEAVIDSISEEDNRFYNADEPEKGTPKQFKFVLKFVDNEGKLRDFVREFIEDEFLAFPVAVHDDMLDCMARITDPELRAEFPEIEENLKFATMARDTNKVETDYDLF